MFGWHILPPLKYCCCRRSWSIESNSLKQPTRWPFTAATSSHISLRVNVWLPSWTKPLLVCRETCWIYFWFLFKWKWMRLRSISFLPEIYDKLGFIISTTALNLVRWLSHYLKVKDSQVRIVWIQSGPNNERLYLMLNLMKEVDADFSRKYSCNWMFRQWTIVNNNTSCRLENLICKWWFGQKFIQLFHAPEMLEQSL